MRRILPAAALESQGDYFPCSEWRLEALVTRFGPSRRAEVRDGYNAQRNPSRSPVTDDVRHYRKSPKCPVSHERRVDADLSRLRLELQVQIQQSPRVLC